LATAPEEVRLDSRGHDQVVEVEPGAVLEHERMSRVVQPGRFPDPHTHVGLPAEDRPQRGADFFRREVVGADLVEQRLERVIAVAVHDCDVRVGAAQRVSGVQPGEARADDHDPQTHARSPAAMPCPACRTLA